MWDIFLAHAGGDRQPAEELCDLLSQRCRVFLDQRDIDAGVDWDRQLAAAQDSSRITAALISTGFADAWYLQEEIARAINLVRNKGHRLVPIYLAGWMDSPPYGLARLHGLSVPDEGGLAPVAEHLLDLLIRSSVRPPALVDLGWESVGRINELLCDLFPTEREARDLRRMLREAGLGDHRPRRSRRDRWSGLVTRLLSEGDDGLAPLVRLAWERHPDPDRFAALLAEDAAAPGTSGDLGPDA